MKHTGKSRHGVALAAQLDRGFCDTDTIIQEIDSAQHGNRRTVRDIYLEEGVDRFRQLETAACRLVAARDEALVIATGGGVCDNAEALESTEGGLLVHIVDTHDAIAKRVFARGIPAFLQTKDERVGRERFRELFDRRVARYDAIAHLRVELDGRPLGSARSLIIATVTEYLNGRK